LLILEKRIRAAGALLIVAATLALSGCVSNQKALDSAAVAPTDPAAEQLAAKTPGKAKSSYRDPMVTNVSGAQQATIVQNSPESMPTSPAAMQPANIGGMAMQPTRINANAMSIFSAPPAIPQNNNSSTIVQPADATAYAPVPGVDATRSSVFSAPSPPALQPRPGELPLPQQSSENTSTTLSSSGETAAIATGSLQTGSMNALYAAPKQNLLDSLSGLVQKASLPGMTRVAPNGLQIQNGNVEVGCFKPNLLHVIKTIENHFGKPVMITSGYRDPEHNRLIGGAEESMHKTCDAADIQVAGVSKWDIAAYVRSLPDRGGVGTYCDTESVHVDTGKSRDWNWGCGAGQRRTLRGAAI
jgi:uncharacterized protein YcbK (DUF882 family)